MNGDERLGSAEERAEPLGQIVQRVAVFAEDDHLAAVALRIEHFGVVLEEGRQLLPFLVRSAAADLQRQRFQVLQDLDFGLEFSDGARRRRLIDDGLFGFLDLRVGRVVEIVDVFFGEAGQALVVVLKSRSAFEDLFFAQAPFEPFPAAPEGLQDRLGRGRQPPLQDGQRESDRSLAAFVLQRIGPVEFLADVVGDALVQGCFGVGELVADGVCPPLGEQRRSVELEQLLLHQPAHQVGGIDGVHAVARPAFETVAIEQRHEKLEVLRFAVMRRRRHEQQMPRELAEELAEAVALGVLDLVAEEGGRHLVGFVANHQVPVGVGQLRLDVLVPAQLVQAADGQRILGEPVAGARRFELVVRQDFEGKLESLVEFVLPLLGEIAGAYDHAAVQVAADQQFLDEQAGHDRLAGAGIVGQEEPERLPRQHLAVDGSDLMRQRIDHRGVDGEQRIEQMGQVDPVRLGDQAEQLPVAVEAPRPPGFADFEGRLAVPVKEHDAGLSGGVFVGELDCRRTVPLDVNYRDEAIGQDALDGGTAREIFELGHSLDCGL